MDKIKNKFLSLIAIVFAFSFAVAVFIGFVGNEKKVYAAGDGAITHGKDYTCVITKDKYDFVTFEYKITSAADTYFQLGVFEDWSHFYAYFQFNSAGYTGACKSVTTKTLEDGYIAVTMDVSDGNDLGSAQYTAGGGAAQQNFIYIRGNWSTADGYIRNVEFGKYPALPDLEMVEGASVRLSEPYGIRFRASVPAALAAAEGVSYGMTIIPYDWVVNYSAYVEAANGDYIAALDGAGVAYRKYECELNDDNGEYYIQASLTNIKEKNLEREFIGIAWYEKDGVKHYAFNENCARSIREVAKKAVIAGGDYSETQEKFLLDTAVHYEYTGEYITITTDKANVGEQIIEFYYKRKTEGGNIRFAVINDDDWNTGFYGYFSIAADNTINAAGVAVESQGNGWYKVKLDPSVMTVKTADPSGFTWFDTVFFNGGTASFDVIGLSVAERPLHPAPEAFTASGGLTKVVTSAAYSTVSFDYKITNGGTISCVLLNNWSNGYGYFTFNTTGEQSDYSGVECSGPDADGFIHVTITLADAPVFTSKPDTINMLWIRGGWTTADGYIDNLKFE